MNGLAGLAVTNGYDCYLRRTALAALNGTTPLIQDALAYAAPRGSKRSGRSGPTSAILILPTRRWWAKITFSNSGGCA